MTKISKKMEELKKFDGCINPPYPKHMLLELTDVCNHKCSFCGNNSTIKKVSFMSKDFAFDILEQAYDLGTRDVGFYMRGEPTLSPILEDCVQYAKKIGYDYVFIDTNGSSSIEKLVRLIDKGIDSIKFSVNSGCSKTYKKIHGYDSFDEVLEKIKYLDLYRKPFKKHVKLFIGYVVTTYNKDEKEKLIKLIGHHVDEIVFNHVHTQGASMKNNTKIRVGTYEKYLPCSMVFNRFHVTADGKLSACCIDYTDNLIMANLKNTTLEEAWNNKKYLSLREKHLMKDVKGTICDVCNLKP